MFLIVCTANPEQLLLCASIVDFDVILLGVPPLQNSFRSRRFENDTLNIFLRCRFTYFGRSFARNKTLQLAEWSGHLTQVITPAILFILFIELSHSVFMPECESCALWASVR